MFLCVADSLAKVLAFMPPPLNCSNLFAVAVSNNLASSPVNSASCLAKSSATCRTASESPMRFSSMSVFNALFTSDNCAKTPLPIFSPFVLYASPINSSIFWMATSIFSRVCTSKFLNSLLRKLATKRSDSAGDVFTFLNSSVVAATPSSVPDNTSSTLVGCNTSSVISGATSATD